MKKTQKIIKHILLFSVLILVSLSIYIFIKFNNVSFEQLIYSIMTSEGTGGNAIKEGIIFVAIEMTVLYSLIYGFKIIYKKLCLKLNLFIRFDTKKIHLKFNFFNISTRLKKIFFLLFVVGGFVLVFRLLGIDKYIKYQISSSNLFEEQYVDPKEVEIQFPSKKRNLIYIYVESLETTNASQENGGALKESYIPKLEELALNNINFSNTSNLGGALYVEGTGWTSAAMIAQTSGIPLKVSIDGNEYKNFGQSLPGAYSLGEILDDNGYTNYLFIGSEADFGGRKDYFQYHGDYKIYDYYYAINRKWIDEYYYVWWGYEDQKLFSFAKESLLEISKKDEPFNFTILTADTHFTDGYLDETCENRFSEKYANAFYCSDKKIYEFINWIKKQDFYENTTIVITGDHFTMQDEFYNDIDKNYNRTVYNTFINATAEPIKEKNRIFSTFDMYPTTLASLGAKINGDRLGLGTNLFSDKQTLIEELGYDHFREEIQKKSFFYDNEILGDTYYEMN